MFKFTMIFGLFLSSVAFLGSVALADTKTFFLNDEGVILGGYDPVAYFPEGKKEGKPVKGKAEFQTKVGEVTYWFSSEANKVKFLADPKHYEPQYGGWCAYAVADSKSKVDSNPKSFIIQDNRLLVFYDGIWGDTRDKWLNNDKKDKKTFLKEADMNWPETKPKDP